LGLDFNILKGLTTDGGRNMCGAHTGLVGNVTKAVLETGTAAPMAIHCIIHQQALCGKNAPIFEVMNIVVQNVNYIRRSNIKAFKLKLTLFTNQLIEKNLAHFPTCKKFKLENNEEFPTDFAVGVLTYLNEQFQTRLESLEILKVQKTVFEFLKIRLP